MTTEDTKENKDSVTSIDIDSSSDENTKPEEMLDGDSIATSDVSDDFDDVESQELFDSYESSQDLSSSPSNGNKKKVLYIGVFVLILVIIGGYLLLFNGGDIAPATTERNNVGKKVSSSAVSAPTPTEQQRPTKGLLNDIDAVSQIVQNSKNQISNEKIIDYGQPPLPTPIRTEKATLINPEAVVQQIKKEVKKRQVDDVVKSKDLQKPKEILVKEIKPAVPAIVEPPVEEQAKAEEIKAVVIKETVKKQNNTAEPKVIEAKAKLETSKETPKKTVVKKKKRVVAKNIRWVLKSAQVGVAWIAKEGAEGELTRIAEGQLHPYLGKVIRIALINGRWVVEGTKKKIEQ